MMKEMNFKTVINQVVFSLVNRPDFVNAYIKHRDNTRSNFEINMFEMCLGFRYLKFIIYETTQQPTLFYVTK